MNRIRIWNRLQNNCKRFSDVYSSYVIIDVNNVRFYQSTHPSTKFTPSTFFIDKKPLSTTPLIHNVEINAKTFVRSSSNKIGRFHVSKGSNVCSLFCHKNSILAASGDRSHSYKSIRCFSEASNIGRTVPTTIQLDGFWKDLSESTAVEFCQNSLVSLQAATGLPWWATIVLATWSVRLVFTLPLALYQNYILAKVEDLKYEMNDIVKELKTETNYAVYKYKWTEDYARKVYNKSLKKQWQTLIERENCHPMKAAVIIIVQIPLWIVLSTSLRNLCYMLPYPTERAHDIYIELTTGGFGWVTNLTVVDHYLAIPVTLGLLNLTIIEMQNLMRSKEPSKTQKYVTNFFRFIAIGMVPLAAYVPAGISLYWASSSAFGIVQNLLLMSPRVRRLARIPPTDSELEEPYKHLNAQFRRRIGIKEISPPETVEKS